MNKQSYWCRKCGAENSMVAHIRIISEGRTPVLNSAGDLDENYSMNGPEEEVVDYECEECSESFVELSGLITTTPPNQTG